jgi:hypothetical protein
MYYLFCDVPCIVCVYMCTVLLPPSGYQIAVKYISLPTSDEAIEYLVVCFRNGVYVYIYVIRLIMIFFYSNCRHVASNSGRDRCTFVNVANQIALVPACSAHIHERLNV